MSRQGARLRGATGRARKRWTDAKQKLAYLRKRRRHAKGQRAVNKYVRAIRLQRRQTIHAGAVVRRYEAALAAFRKLARRPYPHLSGDLDASHEVLVRLERLAVKIGRNIYVTSGLRTQAQQKALYDNRASNPFPVAFCCPCTSEHCRGRAADCLVAGAPIQAVVSAGVIASVGLYALPGDAVHVQLP